MEMKLAAKLQNEDLLLRPALGNRKGSDGLDQSDSIYYLASKQYKIDQIR